MATINKSVFFQQCAENDNLCENSFTECFTREKSECYVSLYHVATCNMIQIIFKIFN